MLYISNFVHKNIVHCIVSRRFISRSVDNHLYTPDISLFLTFFCSIFSNTDPIKHWVKTEIIPGRKRVGKCWENVTSFCKHEEIDYFLITERYCYLIHTPLQKKNNACPPFQWRTHKIGIAHSFLHENFIPSPLWFFKNLNSPKNTDGGGVHSSRKR